MKLPIIGLLKKDLKNKISGPYYFLLAYYKD